MPIKYPEEIKQDAIERTLAQNETLRSIGEIIAYTGIPKRTFYQKGYAKKLKESGYVFKRRGRYGKTISWSYKRLILAWLAENFFNIPQKDEK